MENISLTDRARNVEVLHRVKDRNIVQKIKRGKVSWVGHILHTKCLLKHVINAKIGGRIKVTGNEVEDVSSYWMTLCIRQDTGNGKSELQMALCGEVALQEARDLS